MAREKMFNHVLNLRIDDALQRELERIAGQRGNTESDTARMLLGWGVQAHRAMEARELRRPYDAQEPSGPMRMVIDVRWEAFDPEDEDEGRW